MLWGAVLGSLVLFFWSFGFAASGGIGLHSFTYLKGDYYLDSEYHADEVREAFREVRNKCLDDVQRRLPDDDWNFQGTYEFRLMEATRYNRNNIPKEAYEAFIREVWKSVSDEAEGNQTRDIPAAVKDDIQKGEALWYFRNNLPCFYRWDGQNYNAYGDAGSLSGELLGGMSPMGADERITIGFTEQMLKQGERQYSRILTQTYTGCGGMLISVLTLLAALFLLIPDAFRNRRGRHFYDIIVLASLYAFCTLPDRVQELIVPDYSWTTDGVEILIELFPLACSVAVVSGMMLFSAVHLICLGAGLGKVRLGRAEKEKFSTIFKRDRGFIYQTIKGGKRKIMG